ncbi:MAG: hypothetical protein H0W88_08575 [Parachlamydiaceae bacterium]|nr:hypothetical protein [Parachlamydiaceae bacterium]
MPSKFRSKRPNLNQNDIPTKANRILNLVLVAMVLILVRIWHLAVVQYDQKLEEARRPQKKVVVEPATRATIRDRFNLPLAINKIHYQAAILYSQLREIPSFVWEKDPSGKKVKKFKRREYIRQLAELMANELKLDKERIEDLIHAKASYYAQVPFVIKEELTEKEYYRLKMLAKDWPGIYVRKLPKRYYPRGRVAADVIGYMGAINKQEYENILHEMTILDQYVNSQEVEENDLPPGIENRDEARRRLKDLEEKAYTIHDYVGKTGIEAIYEEELRGFYGKKNFYSDSKGNFLRELPGSRSPVSGHRLLLTISAELQEYAEQLLAQNEPIRVVRLSHLEAVKKTILALKQPWMKGGSITVMDPQTGEILALASYPRFDPNDFISSGNRELNKEKKARINRWFENDAYLASLWNQQQSLERERFNDKEKLFYDEKRLLTWNNYLEFILPEASILKRIMQEISTVNHAITIQQHIDSIRAIAPEGDLYGLVNFLYPNDPHISYKYSPTTKRLMETQLQPHRAEIKEIKQSLDRYFERVPNNYDKVLLIDLCRLAVDHDRFNPDLIAKVGNFTLNTYKETTDAFVKLMILVKENAKELFHDFDFKNWRKKEEKEFLKKKRIIEKQEKKYPKPYIDYLDHEENELFQEFWDRYKWDFILIYLTGKKHEIQDTNDNLESYFDFFTKRYSEIQQGIHKTSDWFSSYVLLQKSIKDLEPQITIQYFKTLRPYNDLNRPLFGRYRGLRQRKNPLEKHLAAAFYPVYGHGYGRSFAYRQASIQGSIFKLVTAYEALIQNYKKFNRTNLTATELNPLIIVDQVYNVGQTSYVGYTKEGKPIPQSYKGGRIPRSLAHQNNGEVDLIRALEVSSNPYFSLLAGECLNEPEDLANAARLFSFGSKTGIDLPGEIAGKVPTDLATNRTGLYAMAIGQHSLVVTPLQTAVMLSAIANGGKVLKPRVVSLSCNLHQTSKSQFDADCSITAGRQPNRDDQLNSHYTSFKFQENLANVGIDFPFFSTTALQNQRIQVHRYPVEVKQDVFMPQIIRYILLKGLKASVRRTHQESTTNLTRLYQQYPEAIRNFTELKQQILGKTSTSESVETIDLDLNEGTNIYTHVWFGSIAFKADNNKKNSQTYIFKDEFGEPELVVVVYLRYGGYGKEAAPLAAQMVNKWRELKQKYIK